MSIYWERNGYLCKILGNPSKKTFSAVKFSRDKMIVVGFQLYPRVMTLDDNI